uniref:Follistatin-related protein 1 n=1 Tax=Gallus gallus TaxID=9031 RepID=A0A8V1A3N4_CHICK
MIWKTLPLLCALLAVARLRAEEEPRSKSKICANVFCGAGRECAVTEKGEPTCLCIEQCKPHKRPVCGSNGKTYLNHCELHRDACLTGSKIQVDYDGHCKEKKSENPAASPVVCYQSDRDELRRRVIQWLEAEIIPDGWFSKGSNYSDVLDKYFKNFDDGDSRLDSTEFLKFVEQNETAVNITTYVDQETNKLLRGLCVDALIELSDENADWKLSFSEFLKCLSPSFNPPEKKCALEDETYEDGAETQVECNRCVCACGNWVCTAMTCEGKNEKMTAHRQQPGQDLTEEELARYVQELQKHQVSMRLGRSVCLQKVSPCLRCSLCFCHFEASVRWRSSVRRDLSCLRGEIQVWGFEEKNNVVTAQGWTKDPCKTDCRLHISEEHCCCIWQQTISPSLAACQLLM